MNVQELIDHLQAIEDKTQTVCIEDWNEGYRRPAVCHKPEVVHGEHLFVGLGISVGKFVCIGAEG